MASFNHLSNGNTPSSELSRSTDDLEIQSHASVDADGLDMRNASQEDRMDRDDPHLENASSEGSIAANQNLQELQQVFLEANSLSQEDRDEVMFERKKNALLLAFIQSRGFSIQDVNSFVNDRRVECSSSKPLKSSLAVSSPSTVEEVSLGEDDGIEDTIFVGLERSMGRKASKALFKKGKRTTDTSTPMELRFEKFEHQMKLNQQKRQENMDRIYCQEQEKLNILKAQEDERIMMTDTANMEPELAEYYKERKKEIMKRVTSSS